MKKTENYDPAGQLDLRELDALATNEAAGFTPSPFVASTMVSVLSVTLIGSAYTAVTGGSKKKK